MYSRFIYNVNKEGDIFCWWSCFVYGFVKVEESNWKYEWVDCNKIFISVNEEKLVSND